MYVCMYGSCGGIETLSKNMYTSICSSLRMYGMYVCMYVCMVCMVCMHLCMYVCMYECGRRVYLCVYICMYVCMYMCIYVYVCIYVCIYVCGACTSAAGQQKVLPSVQDEFLGDGVLLRSPGDLCGARGHDLLLDVLAQGRPQQLLGEVRVGGETHDAGHQVRATQSDEEGDPRAHSVPDQDLTDTCMFVCMYMLYDCL